MRKLVGLVERIRDGSYSGAVAVPGRDEIGVLARAFNALVADLREKDQMIGFLREGMTEMRKGAAATVSGPTPPAAAPGPAAAAPRPADTPTMPIQAQATKGASLQRGEVFADRYEILGTLGKGGMGVVYRARDRQLDEVVALKLLRPEALASDPTLLDRFKQEIKLARQITHRNVLRTHDFGETAGVPYISMEYLEGVTLKDLVRRAAARCRSASASSIAKQMCHGLGAAHETGVVHRDIKPQNMLILPETGELKIMDFGISRRPRSSRARSGLTTAGTVMGTPDYMPPEQAQGKPADFRSDIYSLAVVFFEIFTGKLPFKGETPMAVVVAHIQQPPPRPRSVNPKLSRRARGADPEGAREGPGEALADDRRAARGALGALGEERSRRLDLERLVGALVVLGPDVDDVAELAGPVRDRGRGVHVHVGAVELLVDGGEHAELVVALHQERPVRPVERHAGLLRLAPHLARVLREERDLGAVRPDRHRGEAEQAHPEARERREHLVGLARLVHDGRVEVLDSADPVGHGLGRDLREVLLEGREPGVELPGRRLPKRSKKARISGSSAAHSPRSTFSSDCRSAAPRRRPSQSSEASVGHEADRGLVGRRPALDAVDHPQQHAQVLAEARPHEAAVARRCGTS